MRKYYYANCVLQDRDDNVYLSDSQMSGFEKVLPFNNNIIFNTYYGKLTEDGSKSEVFLGSNIKIEKADKDSWLFSCDSSKDVCYIEASHDYSVQKCFIDQDNIKDKDILKADILQLLRSTSESFLSGCGGVTVHASCIVSDNKAVLFTAPSGTGKSTQAQLWNKYTGAKILSGDRPHLVISDDSVNVHGMPWDGKERIYLQEDYPVAAIVEVRRAKKNTLRKLSSEQAFKLLLNQSFIPMWDDNLKFTVISNIRRLTDSIPFYRLFCLPDDGAVKLLNDILFTDDKSLLKEEQRDMKIKEGFILKNIADEWIVMPAGINIKNFEGAIVLNEVAAFIWNQLEKPVSREDLLSAVLDEYDVDEASASLDLDSLINKFQNFDLLVEN